MNKKFNRVYKSIVIGAIISGVVAGNMTSFRTYAQVVSEKQVEQVEKVREILPMVPYWFPQDLLKWSPSSDQQAPFNKATVPLAGREQGTKSNENQSTEGHVISLSIVNQNTSGNVPQGSNEMKVNNFSYWQYIDTLVYWGGSAGEGIIVPPSADIVDVAHRNGVPVLGTIFFPQMEHGGKIEWLHTALTKNADGSFLFADKLIEAAKYFGFDGWFINQETQGASPEDAQAMKALLAYLDEHKPDDMQIVWYDSMIENGEMAWQNALTENNQMFLVDDQKHQITDGMFLNFGWPYKSLAPQKLLEASRERAERLGVSPYDLYAGIDVQASGYDSKVNWELFAKDGKNPFVSLGLYCPSWTFFSSKSVEEFLEKEEKFWVNESGDPRQVEGMVEDYTKWRGISNYFVEKTPITAMPFATYFNMGNGEAFFQDGQKIGQSDWNNRAIQDVMPTYRWIVDHEGKNALEAEIDYKEAYYGGSSIALKGHLEKDKISSIKLFATDVTIDEDTVISTTLKAPKEVEITLKLTLEGEKEPVEMVLNHTKDNKWETSSDSLKAYEGKTIKTIGYSIKANKNLKDVKINIGGITLTNEKMPVVHVEDAKVIDQMFREGIYADVTLKWEASSKEAYQYQVYKVNEDKSRVLVGSTTNTQYYLDDIRRSGKEEVLNLEIVAINKNLEAGKSAKVSIEWPAYPTPVGDFKASSTFVAPGEKVTLTSNCSEVTEEVEWLFEGADIEKSTEANPVITYSKEGTYSITLKAKNSVGETVMQKEDFITVSKEAVNKVENLALNKKVTASSYVGEGEAPKFAVDGTTQGNSKWCAVGTPPHWIQIDLGKNMQVHEFVIKHAKEGGEADAFNTADYEIHVSTDGKQFTKVVDVVGNAEGITRDAIKPVKARYVKLIVNKPTQGGDTAARIYEIEVMGLNK